VLTLEEAEGLAERAERAPLEAAAVVGQARELRAIANHIYVALARREPPDPAWVRAFDDALRTLIGGVHIEWRDGAFAWRPGDPQALDVVLRRVAWLTAQFLTSADLTYFRRCAGEDCAWFFLDSTRNHSRRWCAMSDCGGRAKARRYYRRKQQQQESRGDSA
ncbi:MAG: CGNR zinc finger domain-containing protein, partial [Gemmatimonadaceae bacterium]|nr:CGNR zinc finger domain-containing protein [Gemmatimonadaceae bacterium]